MLPNHNKQFELHCFWTKKSFGKNNFPKCVEIFIKTLRSIAVVVTITSEIGLVFEFMKKAKHSRGFKVLLQFQHPSSFYEMSKPCPGLPGSSWEARESSTSKKVRLFMPQSFFNFCSSSVRSRRPRSFYSAQRAQVVSPALGFFSASLVNGRGKNTHPHRVGRRRLSPTEAYSVPPSQAPTTTVECAGVERGRLESREKMAQLALLQH